MTKEEHEREYRVVDQMISMHADIAQTKKSQALMLSVGLLFSSAIICGFIFVDDAILNSIGIGPARAHLLIGLASLTIFGLSIVDLRVDWGGVGRAHADAAKRLSQLKAKYRHAIASQDPDKQTLWLALSNEYTDTLSSVAAVPEKSFVRLKGRHHFKRELSRTIDKHPGVPVLLVACCLRCRATWNYLRSKPVDE
jgi:hypothetical protein